MRKASFKVVDGTEAISSVLYRLHDRLLVDCSIPSPYFRDGIDLWIREKRRNLRDRIPELILLPEGPWSPSLFNGQGLEAILTVTDRLPSLVALLKEMPKGRRKPTIVAALENGTLPEAEGDDRILVSGSIQEAADLTVVASMVNDAAGPVVHLFDVTRLSHEIQKIDCLSDEDLRTLVREKAKGELAVASRDTALATARDGCQDSLMRFADWTGRSYHDVLYEGDPEAEQIAVSVGTVTGELRQAVRLLKGSGRRIGLLSITQLSPFDRKALVEKIPGSVKIISTPDSTHLYFRVMDALHEGLTNGWSWFATLPKLNKLRDTRHAARQIFPDIPPDDRSIEVRLDGVSPDGTISLLRLLLGLLGEFLFAQAFLSKDSTIHLRLSPDPILSNEETLHPLIPPPLDTKGIAGSIGPEALPATVLTTAVLKLVLKTGEETGLFSNTGPLLEKWRATLEEYFRPLGPFFVLQNLAAVEQTLQILGADATPEPIRTSGTVEALPNLKARSPESPIPIGNLSLRTRIVPILNEFPDNPQRFNTLEGAGGLLLPLIRETDIRASARRYYEDYAGRPLPLDFRSPPSNRNLGLTPFLTKIALVRSATKLPVFARLSAQVIDSWVGFGVDLQECGVDLLEILFEDATAEGFSQGRLATLARLKKALKIPVMVALSPFEGDIFDEARRLEESGADGLVLFHETAQRDLDPKTGTWIETIVRPGKAHRLRSLEWISRLAQETKLPLIAHGGLSSPEDVLKAISAGAAWAQVDPDDQIQST